MKGDNQNLQRKRKNTNETTQVDPKHQHIIPQQDYDHLDLTLSLPLQPEPEPIVIPPPPVPKPQRARKNNTTRTRSEGGRKVVKSETVPAPYPWATDKRATVHTMKYLLDNGIRTISGEVQCKKCNNSCTIEYDLQEKFKKIALFIMEEQDQWHDRAPEEWTGYKLLTCKFCGLEDGCKPVISQKKRSINWLFLLLGQHLGCCTLDQLKYFCKHTNIHRTGAKNRVLLYTYLALCKQLEPDGQFSFQTI